MEVNEGASVSTAMVRRSRKKAGKFPLGTIFSKIGKRSLLLALVVIALAGLVYYFKGLFIVATVNGQPISRLALVRELEKQGGKQTLDGLITKTLVLQEAKKQGITVSGDEVGEEIKKIEENLTQQGQDLDKLLSTQGMTRNDLTQQIKLQKLVEKMAKKDISVSDQEVNDYLEKNKDTLPKGVDAEQIKVNIKQQLEQQKLNEKAQSLIQSLREKAKINYFLNL